MFSYCKCIGVCRWFTKNVGIRHTPLNLLQHKKAWVEEAATVSTMVKTRSFSFGIDTLHLDKLVHSFPTKDLLHISYGCAIDNDDGNCIRSRFGLPTQTVRTPCRLIKEKSVCMWTVFCSNNEDEGWEMVYHNLLGDCWQDYQKNLLVLAAISDPQVTSGQRW